MEGFDLERYLRNSKKVDTSDIAFAEVPRHPLSEGEVRCLTYMMDIESHTVVYLRGLLSTCAIDDPQTTSFLSCWVYEEFFHGRTLRQFLEAAGVRFSPTRFTAVKKSASLREWLEDMGASFICQVTRHFHAAYLTWGAINELSTLEGYGALIRRTQHPLLAEVLRRLAKDERRHFSFYYNKAKLLLAERNAQRLTTLLLRKFWTPVGSGVKPDPEVDWVTRFVFGDQPGREAVQRIDATIAKLPGLDWFDRLTRSLEGSLERLGPASLETCSSPAVG